MAVESATPTIVHTRRPTRERQFRNTPPVGNAMETLPSSNAGPAAPQHNARLVARVPHLGVESGGGRLNRSRLCASMHAAASGQGRLGAGARIGHRLREVGRRMNAGAESPVPE